MNFDENGRDLVYQAERLAADRRDEESGQRRSAGIISAWVIAAIVGSLIVAALGSGCGPEPMPECPRASGMWISINECGSVGADGDRNALCAIGPGKLLSDCRIDASDVACVSRCP